MEKCGGQGQTGGREVEIEVEMEVEVVVEIEVEVEDEDKLEAGRCWGGNHRWGRITSAIGWGQPSPCSKYNHLSASFLRIAIFFLFENRHFLRCRCQHRPVRLKVGHQDETTKINHTGSHISPRCTTFV